MSKELLFPKIRNRVKLLEDREDREDKLNTQTAKKIVNKSTNSDDLQITATVKAERLRILSLDIVVLICILFLFFRHIIFPFLGYKHKSYIKLIKVLHVIYNSIVNDPSNLFLFFCLLLIILIFLSFEDLQIKQIGLIVLISFISSIAVEAKQFITGAVFAGIAGYIYLRFLTLVSPKLAIISKSGDATKE